MKCGSKQMNIVIFEDDEYFAIQIESKVHECGYKVVLNTGDWNILQNHVLFSEIAELYLVDIFISHKPLGKQVFNLLRNSIHDNLCVFITNFPNYVMENPILKIGSFSFIDKNRLNELPQTLLLAENRIKRCNLFIYKNKFSKISITMSGIYYIESINGKINLIHEDGSYSFRATLNMIKNKLDSNFIQCHRSYLVNIKQISEYRFSDQKIIMKNGMAVPMVRSRIEKWLF